MSGEYVAGTALKSMSGWYDSGNGTDAYGFSVLPVGYCSIYGNFYDDVGDYAYFWSATEGGTGNADFRYLNYYHADMFVGGQLKDIAVSVRCLKDAE